MINFILDLFRTKDEEVDEVDEVEDAKNQAST